MQTQTGCKLAPDLRQSYAKQTKLTHLPTSTNSLLQFTGIQHMYMGDIDIGVPYVPKILVVCLEPVCDQFGKLEKYKWRQNTNSKYL